MLFRRWRVMCRCQKQTGIVRIVYFTFGLSLGAIAVAVALSFGLGGGDAAGKHMEYLLTKFRADEQAKGDE